MGNEYRGCDVCKSYPLCRIYYKLNKLDNEDMFMNYSKGTDYAIASICRHFVMKEAKK